LRRAKDPLLDSFRWKVAGDQAKLHGCLSEQGKIFSDDFRKKSPRQWPPVWGENRESGRLLGCVDKDDEGKGLYGAPLCIFIGRGKVWGRCQLAGDGRDALAMSARHLGANLGVNRMRTDARLIGRGLERLIDVRLALISDEEVADGWRRVVELQEEEEDGFLLFNRTGSGSSWAGVRGLLLGFAWATVAGKVSQVSPFLSLFSFLFSFLFLFPGFYLLFGFKFWILFCFAGAKIFYYQYNLNMRLTT
jgi:hypothetical protein